MATIGSFSKSGDGYTGSVKTLTLNVKAQFRPSEKDSDKAPDFRILVPRAPGWLASTTARSRLVSRGCCWSGRG